MTRAGMRHRAPAIVITCSLVASALFLPVTAVAQATAPLEVTASELVTIDRALDGALVTFVGEAIGEDLRADANHRWVNVLGDGTAVGVYVTGDEAARVGLFGNHRQQGDTVRVVGTLNIACDEHGGEFDVHAIEFEVVEAGAPTERPIQSWKGIVGAVLLLVAIAQLKTFRYLQERHLT